LAVILECNHLTQVILHENTVSTTTPDVIRIEFSAYSKSLIESRRGVSKVTENTVSQAMLAGKGSVTGDHFTICSKILENIEAMLGDGHTDKIMIATIEKNIRAQ
jgi:hypothetical protein